mmetsp:Transcript_15678/g.42994  ORF Transcript_15678/g.42994 Transcript_15678/m.42994 type:complete len:442 (-) Transcript_15678:386-1711(-)
MDSSLMRSASICARVSSPSVRKSSRFFLRRSAFILICTLRSSWCCESTSSWRVLRILSSESASLCTRRMRPKSSRSCCASSIIRRSFSSFCASLAAARAAFISSCLVTTSRSFFRHARSASSIARLARSASSSACLSFIFSCLARSRAVSRSRSALRRCCSSSCSCSRFSFARMYAWIRAFSSFSFCAACCLRMICEALESAVSRSNCSPTFFRAICCLSSSAFICSCWRIMASRSWSCISSRRARSRSRSLIWSMITMEPSRFASARLLSRSSYILSALSRSISMMVSRRRSSSCRSFSIIFFSLTWASRIVTTFAYKHIWFILLTSSSSSESFFSASVSTRALACVFSASSAVGGTDILRSASSRRMRSLRSCAFIVASILAAICSRCASCCWRSNSPDAVIRMRWRSDMEMVPVAGSTSPLVCCIRREPVRSACGGGG